jgi:hypothetical protein
MKQDVHYHVHNSPPSVPTLRIHSTPSLFNIYFILSSHLFSGLPNGIFPPVPTLHQNPVCITLCPTNSYPPPLFDHPNNIWGRVGIMKLHNFLQSPSYLLGPSMFLNTLFLNTLCLCHTLKMTDCNTHTCCTTVCCTKRDCVHTRYNKFAQTSVSWQMS